MKSSDNLNKALRDALKDHPEPLHDGQWDKLYRGLHEKKSKRIFPWFGFWIMLLVTGLTGFLTGYLLNSEYRNSNPIAVNSQVTVSPENTATNHSNSNRAEIDLANEQVQNSELNQNSNANFENSNLQTQNNTSNNRHPLNLNQDKNSKLAQNEQLKPDLSKSLKNRNPKTKTLNPIDHGKSDNASNSFDKEVIDNKKFDLTQKDNGTQNKVNDKVETEKPESQNEQSKTGNVNNVQKNDSLNHLATNDKDADKTDTNKKKAPIKKPKKPSSTPTEDSKWVFGLNIGLSTFNTKIGGYSAAGAVHKDVKDVNDNSIGNKNSKSFRLSVNYRFLKGLSLGFNTGLQYRTVREERNYNYKLTELPWRKTNNDIDFYIPLKDSQVFLTVNESRESEFRYVTIPFTFSYNFKLSKTMELTTSLGANINYLAKAKAQVLDLDKFDFSELSAHAGPRVNIGWMGSAMLSRHITGPWWIGFEFGLQRNRQKYKLEYSDYKSFNTFANYNLCLRYKL